MLTLNGQGKSWGELAHNARGTATLSVGNGSLAGFDLATLADDLRDPLGGPVQAGDKRTAFTALKADVAIAEGALSTDNLTVTGADFALTLAGKGSLIGGAVEGQGTLASGGETEAVAVSGTWSQPEIGRAAQPAPAPPSPN
jgi:uncharacterized protein involved in outer membrane biogenesis